MLINAFKGEENWEGRVTSSERRGWTGGRGEAGGEGLQPGLVGVVNGVGVVCGRGLWAWQAVPPCRCRALRTHFSSLAIRRN